MMTFAQDMVGLRPKAQQMAQKLLQPEWTPDF
jgi:hypothetical protein